MLLFFRGWVLAPLFFSVSWAIAPKHKFVIKFVFWAIGIYIQLPTQHPLRCVIYTSDSSHLKWSVSSLPLLLQLCLARSMAPPAVWTRNQKLFFVLSSTLYFFSLMSITEFCWFYLLDNIEIAAVPVLLYCFQTPVTSHLLDCFHSWSLCLRLPSLGPFFT